MNMKRLYWKIQRIPRILFVYYPRCIYQTIRYGFPNSEIWNLDYNLARHILPRLRRFRELHSGIPGSFISCYECEDDKTFKADLKRWEDCIDKMILAFEKIIEEGEAATDDPEIEEGLRLFAENMGALWT